MNHLAEPLNDAVIRHTFSVLPFGNGLVGHAELLRQLLLCQILPLALARDVAADGCLIHFKCLLYEDALSLEQCHMRKHPPAVEFAWNAV